jgi:hypothetical protein
MRSHGEQLASTTSSFQGRVERGALPRAQVARLGALSRNILAIELDSLRGGAYA